MDVNDDFQVEEELSGSEGGRESAGGGGGAVVTRGRKLQQNKAGRGKENLP